MCWISLTVSRRPKTPMYTIKNRTPNSVENAIFRWHTKIENEDYEKSRNASWRGINDIMYLFELQGRSYRFKEMTTGEDLYLESQALGHCVFSYVKWCKNGSCSIYSMQEIIDNGFSSCLTIEVENNEIVQASGEYNRTINNLEADALKRWSACMNFLFEPDFFKICFD